MDWAHREKGEKDDKKEKHDDETKGGAAGPFWCKDSKRNLSMKNVATVLGIVGLTVLLSFGVGVYLK